MLDDAYKLEKCVKIALLYLEVKFQSCLPSFLNVIMACWSGRIVQSLFLLIYAPLYSQNLMIALQDDDAINAEIFIKKASFLVNNCKDEALNLQYKVCYVCQVFLFLAQTGCIDLHMFLILD
jgi:hypothetical protein